MKKVLAGLILTSLLVLPAIGLAAVETAPNVNVMEALDRIANWVFTILMVVALIFLIWGAYNFVTAAGEAEKVTAGKQSIMWALVGVAVALLARGLVALVRLIVTGV
jgi:TRAP-type C4-dicarboxylate transport system permease small subunit